MTTTPAQAIEAVSIYVKLNIIGYRATDRVYEDATDYFVEIEPEGEPLMGPGFMFVSKATGKAYMLAPMEGVEKAHLAQPVPNDLG